MDDLKPVWNGGRVRCQGRRIDFDGAVQFMDAELLRDAIASTAEQRRDRINWFTGNNPHGISLLYRRHPEDQADDHAQDLWDEYTKLHQDRYDATFDPPLPNISQTEEEFWREHEVLGNLTPEYFSTLVCYLSDSPFSVRPSRPGSPRLGKKKRGQK